jgi:RNA polymerase sigma factor (sigma-70 family)
MASAAYIGEYRNSFLSGTAGKIRLLESAIVRLFAAASSRTFSREERAEQNLLAEKILDDYGNSILRLAYMYLHNRSDAEEILQDTLIRFLQTAPQFENEIHKKAWLLRVAGNLSKNRIEYNRVRNTEELNEELVSEERDDLSFVWEAVKALPVKYREVIHLFYQEGYQTAEIASILHENEATVRSDLNRGRAKLREVLKEAYDFA